MENGGAFVLLLGTETTGPPKTPLTKAGAFDYRFCV